MTPLPAPLRLFSRPMPLALALALGSAIPVFSAAVLSVQIPLGAVPESSQRLMIAPVALFAHVLGGVLFGLCGPVQFIRALRHRFGRFHRVTGVVFVMAGLFMGASGLVLLARVSAPPLPEIARALASIALIAALLIGLFARPRIRHRAWMIRAYAIGMGLSTVGLAFFPIFLITGAPPSGLVADLIFVGCWALNALLAEIIIHTLEKNP